MKYNMEYGEACINERRLSLADFCFRKVVENEPTNTKAWMRLIECAMFLKKPGLAKKRIEKCKEVLVNSYVPYHFEYLLNLGLQEVNIDSYFEQIEEKFKGNMGFQYDKFVYCVGTERYSEAIEIANRFFIKSDNTFQKIADDLLIVYEEMKDNNMVEKILLRLLDIRFDSAYVVRLIRCYYRMNDMKKIAEICDSVISEHNDDVSVAEKLVIEMAKANATQDDELEKRCCHKLLDISKKVNVNYPTKYYVDLISIACMINLGQKEEAMRMLEYMESITEQDKIQELVYMKKLISQCEDGKDTISLELKEISPRCSLEGPMLKLKLQYFGHMMRRADSL